MYFQKNSKVLQIHPCSEKSHIIHLIEFWVSGFCSANIKNMSFSLVKSEQFFDYFEN